MGQSKFAVATFGYFGSLKLLSQAASAREFSLVAVFDAAALLLPLQVLPAWGFVLSFVGFLLLSSLLLLLMLQLLLFLWRLPVVPEEDDL